MLSVKGDSFGNWCDMTMSSKYSLIGSSSLLTIYNACYFLRKGLE